MNQEDLKLTNSPVSPVVETPSNSPRSHPAIIHSSPAIAYQVAMSRPETHLFEVTLQVSRWEQPTLELRMPVWTPGSYLVREYSRHLQDFAAYGEEKSLPWRKLRKNHWQIDTQGQSEVAVRYHIFANELTVRTNHLDETHGYFNGAALFLYVPGFEKQAVQIKIVPPRSDWRTLTTLPVVPGQDNTFEATDLDTLIDSPFEIGHHEIYPFEAVGKPHALAIWGQGNVDPDRLIDDTQKIIQVEADLFGGLPYDRYLFLLHLTSNGFGGLEHKDSCSLIYSRTGFRAKDKYDRFMQLVAHEFFHLWNVKRIRPKGLDVFDYEGENYTPSLWFSEGTTSFYDLILPYRAGIYDAKTYLKSLSQEITRYLTTPGRLVQPLSESSFDAWIKLYRPDANSANSQISYYLKGEMVTLLLDLGIRLKHSNGRSFDDVMRQMWKQFGKDEIGFTPEQLKATIEAIAGFDLSDFFDRYIDGGIEELPFDEYLAGFGLRLQSNGEKGDRPPHLGMMVKTEFGREMIKFVEANSPAQRAGIDAGNELLAIDGARVSADQLNDRLKDYQAGDVIEIAIFYQDELRVRSITLLEPRPNQYQIVTIENPSAIQQQNFQNWLGVPLTAV